MELTPFERSPETALNLKNHTFFHGAKTPSDVADIQQHGFRSEYTDTEGRWFRDGNLGVGVYLSCNWKTALWFGPILLRVTLLEGTRIFDVGQKPQQDVLQSMVRRYGKEILDVTDFRRALHSNKSLRFEEFSELFRYHYHQTWKAPTDFTTSWKPARIAHSRALYKCVNHLRHCGFHGYGDPADDNGILIFHPERIKLEEVIAEVPGHEHYKLTDSIALSALCMRQLRKRYPSSL